ncbi:uncharacterized protein [Clytia hemisphaerica]|uniref:uncharacterized protein n=1 Tax=Clytia hemisphaerica TaxID=252671 RepID=UPI0034D5419A
MSPLERFQKLRSKGLCYQCLYPGAQRKSGKHQDGQCQRAFICKHPYHDPFTTKMHVLVCDSHKDDQQNLLEHYKSRCLTRQRQLPSFSKEINLSHLEIEEHPPIKDEANTVEKSNPIIKAMYMLQTIEVDGKVERDIQHHYQEQCGDPIELPSLPKRVGGDVDFMIGIRHLSNFPEKVFELPSGLTIYKSKFRSVDGSQGVTGGPHEVNVYECITTATLPLLQNPETALAPNRNIALCVYNQQVKRLAKNQQDKDDIIESESKLQSLGYVEYVKNLPIDQQRMLQSNPVQNFIPWRAVWKPSSISTPCRVVYDASMPTESGKSLNDILPRGRNGMNKLLETFLRWRGQRFAFHTDIQKMYNTIKLDQSHWCLQRYLWHESLAHDLSPDEKIIKTLMYGVKSSGNQAEFGLRETAEIFQDQHPDVHRTVSKDIYVDDCLSGHSTRRSPRNIQRDRSSHIPRYRDKKVGVINEVPAKLTRRQCVSKASEVFDLSGIITPITASLKLDLHDLRACGNYSCQLIFARSRILPEDMTQPRGELVAALLNAHTSEIVHQAFSTQHNASHKLTDSQIVLHWLCNEDRPLKKWLRSRVVEIKHFSSFFMIADIATRRCDSNEVIAPNSTWINGFPWITGEDFPNLTAKKISLSQKEQQEVSKEVSNRTTITLHQSRCQRSI